MLYFQDVLRHRADWCGTRAHPSSRPPFLHWAQVCILLLFKDGKSFLEIFRINVAKLIESQSPPQVRSPQDWTFLGERLETWYYLKEEGSQSWLWSSQTSTCPILCNCNCQQQRPFWSVTGPLSRGMIIWREIKGTIPPQVKLRILLKQDTALLSHVG